MGIYYIVVYLVKKNLNRQQRKGGDVLNYRMVRIIGTGQRRRKFSPDLTERELDLKQESSS